MPRALQGPAAALAMGSAVEFDVRGGMGARAAFESAYQADVGSVLNSTGRQAFEAMRTLERKTAGEYRPANGAAYPRTPFGQSMQEIARLAKADVGLEIAFAESGQWDHHAGEGSATGQMAQRLDDFSRSIAALALDLGDRMGDTVILTMSEFGRAVAENGARGTDHGHGNAMFVIGGGVKGGQVYGKWPGLAREQRYEGRDLAVTTDFRDVFGEVVVKHLACDLPTAGKVFPGYAVKREAFRGVLKS
jgi:uncharacterized protein (DUF1501 family)